MNQLLTFLTAAASNNTTAQNAEDLHETIGEVANEIPQFITKVLDLIKVYGIRLLIALVICFVLKKLINVLIRFMNTVFERSKIDVGVSKFLTSVVKTVCHLGLFFAFVLVMNNGELGGVGTAITAIFTALSLAIGLSLQGSLQNFAGGVLILILKPFKLGDYIVSSGYEGVVESIDIFYTRLLTIDNQMVVLPNGALSNASITNVTREEVRRLDLTVGIEYTEDVSKVKGILLGIIDSKEQVLKDRPINVFINNFEASSISMGLRMWCKTEDFWMLRWDMLESIKEEFDHNGIVIPYNQLDVNVKQMTVIK